MYSKLDSAEELKDEYAHSVADGAQGGSEGRGGLVLSRPVWMRMSPRREVSAIEIRISGRRPAGAAGFSGSRERLSGRSGRDGRRGW